MTKKLCSLMAIASVCGAFVAGCGSSSSSSSSASSSSAAPAAASSSATSSATSSASAATSTPSTGGAGIPANLSAAVAQCKASINAAPNLSADAKTKLQSLCDEAAKGDATSLKKTTAAVCQQIIKDTVPASAQAAALASCPQP